ncbi:MAG: TM2 domain-containing protein [Spirochaetia bacterium]|nr:TM2 domain-containing protein [Spirochaetia bacterium]
MKDSDTYSTLLYSLGCLGAHRMYLGEYSGAMMYLISCVTGFIFIAISVISNSFVPMVIGIFILLIDLVLCLYDLVKLKETVEEANNRIKSQIIKNL